LKLKTSQHGGFGAYERSIMFELGEVADVLSLVDAVDSFFIWLM
jgi:hypothetical protein